MASGYDGQLTFNTKIDEKGFNKGTKNLSKQVGGLTGAFKKLGVVLAGVFAVQKMGAFVKSAIENASNLEEVENVVRVAFGNMSEEVDKFAKNAIEKLGMSEYAFKKTASTFMAIAKGMDMQDEMAKNMALNLTALTADMASFFNVKQEVADIALKSVFTGETETLKQFGVVMTQTNLKTYLLSKGITKQYEKMTEAEKVQVRYGYVMKTLALAQGDFARTTDSWANQTRVLSERWKQFMTVMGSGFIQLFTPVVKVLNAIISRLMILAEYFKAFVGAFFGAGKELEDKGKETEKAVGGMGGATTDASKEVAKAGKKIKGSLAGFDELNTLADNTAEAMEDMSNSAGADLGLVEAFAMDTSDMSIEIDTSKVEGAVKIINDSLGRIKWAYKLVVDYVVQDILPIITPQIERAKALFQTVFQDLGTLGQPLQNWFTTSFIPMLQGFLPIITQVFTGTLESVINVFTSIWNAVFPILQVFVTDGLRIFTEFLTIVGNTFKNMFDIVKGIFDDLWSGAIDPALQLISQMLTDTLQILVGYWDEHGKAVWEKINTFLERIKELWDELWKFLQPMIQKALDTLKELWDGHIKGFIETLLDFVGTAIQGAMDFINEFVMPLVKWLVEKLGPTFVSIFATVMDTVETALGVIIDVAGGIIRSLGGIINFLVGVFTGNWEKAWEGIGDFVGGIFDSVVGVIKGAINLIIGALNTMIRGLNKIKIKAPDWVPVIGGQNWGVSIPEIPKLAQGAVIPPNSEFMAILGDQKSGTNIETPLATMIDAFKTAIAETGLGGGGESTIILKISETELGRATVKSIRNLQRQTGVSMLTV